MRGLILPRDTHEVVWTKEKIKKFWEFYENNSIFKEWFFAESGIRHIFNFSRGYISKDSKVLDIGIGTGILLKELQKFGCKCYGIDISEKNVENLKAKLPNVELRVGEVARIPYQDNTFDVIFMIELIEHLLLEDIIVGLREAGRTLKPRGYLIITTPYEEDLRKKMIICPDCGAVFHRVQHLHSFDKNKIKDLLVAANFKVIKCKIVSLQPLKVRMIKSILNFIRRKKHEGGQLFCVSQKQ